MECRHAVSLLVFVLLLRWPALSSAGAPVSRTITVDRNGRGDFRRIQSAVNLVPDGNREWVRIHVRAGGYRENVTIPREKGYILLEGDGSWNTDIYFDNYAHGSIDDLMRSGADAIGTYDSATFKVYADNFVARDISFTNTHNTGNKTNAIQALAALVNGDRISFHRCAFRGFQDTLCDNTGRHYFHECFIKGGIDFIFGYAQSIYEGCTLVSNIPLWYGRHAGWVTAHARLHAGDPGGFVFKGGEVRGTGRLHLGRAWNKYATVVYYHVNMSSVVVPQGWAPWYAGRETNDVLFTEVGCIGPGSNMAGRVPWEKHLTEAEVGKFVDMSFIDDGWLSEQP
ncbi:probable pectinesterase 66 [Hordeum vulgare subsp. vulgare]|uniref:pectinesterase n=1 Tax=Hordeum vulgare subsp. vulgare TaxID=112509 RepID=A0A8I6X2A9_HORVV|nr:probable pectinesterase 66 [Hordeum vulgare subsp. vulgare]